jgi:hypothetical protein
MYANDVTLALSWGSIQYCIKQLQQSFQTIEVLQEHGIAANDIEKLRNGGFHTVESVRSNMVYCKDE